MSEQNTFVDVEGTAVAEKVPSYTDTITEKRGRGPDKVQRNYNPISKQNLRQYRIGTELSTPIAESSENVLSFSSKLLLVALIIVLISIVGAIVGAIIWKIYRDYKEKRS